MKAIAHVISTIFQPLLMPIYGVMLIFVYTYFGMIYLPQFWQILLPAALFSFAIPAMLIYMLYRMKMISDLSLKIRRERFYPYLITLISYSAMILYYHRMGMPTWFLMIMAASVVIMVIAILITSPGRSVPHVRCGRPYRWCYGGKLLCGTFQSLLYVYGVVHHCRTGRHLATDPATPHTAPGDCRFPAGFYGLISLCLGWNGYLTEIVLPLFDFPKYCITFTRSNNIN